MDVFQAAVVGGHAGHELKARGKIVQQLQIGFLFAFRIPSGVNVVVEALKAGGLLYFGGC